MKKRSKDYIASTAQDIQMVSALEARKIAYIPRVMAYASLPSSAGDSNEFIRRNGDYQLSILAPSSIGLPYGTYPRLIMSWIATQSKISGKNKIYLGKSLSAFIKNLGKSSTGGAHGSILSLKEQCKRLFSCSIQWTYENDMEWSIESLRIAKKASMIWEPRKENDWEAYLTIDQDFFKDIQRNAIPVDQRVLDACSHYIFAIDTYCWLTHKYYKLRKPMLVPWNSLPLQFSNSYSRSSHFKLKFSKALQRVKIFYPKARFSFSRHGVWLYPSPPHIPPIHNLDFLNSS